MDSIFCIAELCDILQNLFQKIKKLLAVDVIFKGKFGIVLKNFLKYLIGCFLINTFTIGN